MNLKEKLQWCKHEITVYRKRRDNDSWGCCEEIQKRMESLLIQDDTYWCFRALYISTWWQLKGRRQITSKTWLTLRGWK